MNRCIEWTPRFERLVLGKRIFEHHSWYGGFNKMFTLFLLTVVYWLFPGFSLVRIPTFAPLRPQRSSKNSSNLSAFLINLQKISNVCLNCDKTLSVVREYFPANANNTHSKTESTLTNTRKKCYDLQNVYQLFEKPKKQFIILFTNTFADLKGTGPKSAFCQFWVEIAKVSEWVARCCRTRSRLYRRRRFTSKYSWFTIFQAVQYLRTICSAPNSKE